MSRAHLAAALALLMLSAPLAAAVVPPLPPETARRDADGATTLRALLDDATTGTWREFPVSDAGIAAFTNALASRGVTLDDKAFARDVKGLGVYLHSWELAGTPYVTLGTYAITTQTGKVRVPVVIVENVTDLGALAALVGSVVTDDAMPIAAEMLPHAYGLAAPDTILAGVLGGVAVSLAGSLAYSAILTLGATDASNPAANVPAEVYPVLESMSLAIVAMGAPLVYGQFGVGGIYDTGGGQRFTDDWTDRPEVRFWFARKVAAGHEAWAGVALSRTGESSGDPVYDWSAWKRLSVGPVARIDGEIVAPAAAYVRVDATRSFVDDPAGHGPTRIENHFVLTAGVAANGADTPLAQVRMDETRDDSADENFPDDGDGEFGIDEGEATYLPGSQQEDWSVGPVVAGSYVPLVGARTTSAHRGHADVTNLGAANYEWESERITSAGVYVLGEYVPLVGARVWAERAPVEIYAATLALEGVGSQNAGDAEASVGTFALGVYVPVAGGRYDDDFDLHLHAHRGLASAGLFVGGAYEPLAGTTYDGEVTQLAWTQGRAAGASEGNTRWQTSSGTFTLGFYRPVVGARFEPATHDASGFAQESYQLGIYPLLYDPFIPVASVDYNGDVTSVLWALGFAGAQLDGPREGEWHADVVAYTPGPFAFPLAGARYFTDAPDGSRAFEEHAQVGVWGPDGFTPLVGASYMGDASPAAVGATMVGAVTGTGHANAVVSVGVYDPTTGQYTPVATVDTARLPR